MAKETKREDNRHRELSTSTKNNSRAIAMIEESANPETRHLRRCWDCLVSQDE